MSMHNIPVAKFDSHNTQFDMFLVQNLRLAIYSYFEK
jgi:hypothetical protein